MRTSVLALALLLALAGMAMLSVQFPGVGISALGALLAGAVAAERRWASHRGSTLLASKVDDADVSQAYRFFLGRDPESAQAMASNRAGSKGDLIRRLLTSTEYEERVVLPTVQGARPVGGLFDEPPDGALLGWATVALPLGDEVRRRLRHAADWTSAHAMVLSDPALRRAFPSVYDRLPPEASAVLAAAAQGPGVIAEIEEAAGRTVRGYALDRTAPEGGLVVELWIDGGFAGAVPADDYRRDLEERFGGTGLYGFTFEDVEAREEGRGVKIEVRDSVTKRVLSARRMTRAADLSAARLGDIALALKEAQRGLNALADAMVQASTAVGFTTALYGAYWRAFSMRTPETDRRDREEQARFAWRPRLDVLVTGDPLDGPAFDATEATLSRQSYPDQQVLRIHPGGEPPAWDGDYVLLLDAGDQLAVDALHRIAAAAQGDCPPGWLIFDSDTVDAEGDHRDPILRPGFDPDLLLQTPYLGASAAVRSQVLRDALEAGGRLEPGSRADLWLRVSEACPQGARHIPRVLHHRASAGPAAPADRWAKDVREHLQRTGSNAKVVQAPASASIPWPHHRIAWPLGVEATAAVIVPTRDRLDLLAPCLSSLEASRAANQTAFEIVVVDNASTDGPTLQALDALSGKSGCRVIRYDGDFNWSGINNLAAGRTEADVLVFLNNDTVVITPNWCDALCAQALRPEIGAVGARLLFADGSIQHAGIVLGTAQTIAAHEGAGASGSDDGYLGRRGLAHRAAAVTGACLATRRTLFERLGGFDATNLVIEANDIDYCLRVRREGLGVLYEPACTFYHYESRSRGHTAFDAARQARAERELDALRRRWGAELARDPYYNAHFDRRSPPFSRLGPPPDVEAHGVSANVDGPLGTASTTSSVSV